MKTIWKVQLEIGDLQTVILPKNAEILTVQVQHDKVQLWALVNPEEPDWGREIEIFGTGHQVPGGTARKYIGTIQLLGGELVFHVFEKLS